MFLLKNCSTTEIVSLILVLNVEPVLLLNAHLNVVDPRCHVGPRPKRVDDRKLDVRPSLSNLAGSSSTNVEPLELSEQEKLQSTPQYVSNAVELLRVVVGCSSSRHGPTKASEKIADGRSRRIRMATPASAGIVAGHEWQRQEVERHK